MYAPAVDDESTTLVAYVDGVSVPTLVMTRAGVPANPFFQPYVPQPGTITA